MYQDKRNCFQFTGKANYSQETSVRNGSNFITITQVDCSNCKLPVSHAFADTELKYKDKEESHLTPPLTLAIKRI